MSDGILRYAQRSNEFLAQRIARGLQAAFDLGYGAPKFGRVTVDERLQENRPATGRFQKGLHQCFVGDLAGTEPLDYVVVVPRSGRYLCLANSHLSPSRLIFSDEADTLPASC